MPREVIMPVLGMNQDSGSIASWYKKVGDYVNEGEILMDIETDKAVTEIEARASGYLTKIFYPAGHDVPVGQIVALIEDEAGSVGDADVAELPQEPLEEKKEQKSETIKTMSAVEKASAPDLPVSGKEKILSSPKARRLANEHDVSLQAVFDFTKKRPLHAKDVLTFVESKPSEGHFQAEQISIQLKVASEGIKACEAWLMQQANHSRQTAHLIATLASNILCQFDLLSAEKSIVIHVDSWQKGTVFSSAFQAPDNLRFSSIEIIDKPAKDCHFHLIYVSDCPITAIQMNTASQPILIVSEEKDALQLQLLGYSKDKLPALMQFSQQFATALEQPLLHLL